jgi:hypothetical protein
VITLTSDTGAPHQRIHSQIYIATLCVQDALCACTSGEITCEGGHEVIPGRGLGDSSAAHLSRAGAEALTPSHHVSPNRTRPSLRDDRASLPMQQWLRRFEEVRRAHRAGDFVRSACPHNFRTPHTRHVCCRARRGGAQACTAPGAAHRRRHLSNAVARRGFPGLNFP